MRNDSYNDGVSGSDKELESLFGTVFQKHEKGIYKLALKVVKSDQQARDITQTVFLKLWEHRSQLNEIQNIEAWLHRVTRNELIDFLRKAAADERMLTTLWKDMKLSAKQTEEQLDAKEFNAIIHLAIDQLPDQRKLVYKLNRDNGLNYQEIAEELSISRHTVKNHLFLALRSLHRFLSGTAGFIIFLLSNK